MTQAISASTSIPRIRFVLEYDETDRSAVATILYNGEPFDPRDSDNELSLKIVGNLCESFTYSADSTQDYTNCVVARIR